MTKLTLTLGALGVALSLGACAPQQPQVVSDPYAGTGRYPGQLPGGQLSGQATAEYFRNTVGDTVRFDKDQTALNDNARSTLSRQAEWLTTNTGFSSVVEGHAEEQGTREYNLALGARRAGAVQEYLISKGVPANRVRTVSYGKERPAATCADETCAAENRRAVTVVTPGSGV